MHHFLAVEIMVIKTMKIIKVDGFGEALQTVSVNLKQYSHYREEYESSIKTERERKNYHVIWQFNY